MQNVCTTCAQRQDKDSTHIIQSGYTCNICDHIDTCNCSSRFFPLYSSVFCVIVGLFLSVSGLFYSVVGLIYPVLGLFYFVVGLFYSVVGLFLHLRLVLLQCLQLILQHLQLALLLHQCLQLLCVLHTSSTTTSVSAIKGRELAPRDGLALICVYCSKCHLEQSTTLVLLSDITGKAWHRFVAQVRGTGSQKSVIFRSSSYAA